MIASPMTYRIGDVQYVAIMAGGFVLPGYADYRFGNRGRIVTFRLGGGGVPQRDEIDRSHLALLEVGLETTPAQVALGSRLFNQNCAACHASGPAPDLTAMELQDYESFDDIVLRGAWADRGMANFSGALSEEEAHAIRAFIVQRARHQFGGDFVSRLRDTRTRERPHEAAQ